MNMAAIYIKDIGIIIIIIGAVVFFTSLLFLFMPQIISLIKRKRVLEELESYTDNEDSKSVGPTPGVANDIHETVTMLDNHEVAVTMLDNNLDVTVTDLE